MHARVYAHAHTHTRKDAGKLKTSRHLELSLAPTTITGVSAKYLCVDLLCQTTQWQRACVCKSEDEVLL